MQIEGYQVNYGLQIACQVSNFRLLELPLYELRSNHLYPVCHTATHPNQVTQNARGLLAPRIASSRRSRCIVGHANPLPQLARQGSPPPGPASAVLAWMVHPLALPIRSRSRASCCLRSLTGPAARIALALTSLRLPPPPAIGVPPSWDGDVD